MSELISVTCPQMGFSLTKSIIASYTKALTDNKKVSDILTDLLAYQEVASIVLGGVSAILDVVIPVEVVWLDVWSACKLVREIAGGFLYVDFDPTDPMTRRLWLVDVLGENKGQQIRLGKNLTSISHVTDYIDYCNRLYPVGASGLSLNSKTYSRVDPTKSTDATYGYLTLQGLYAAYKDWSAAGSALPANVKIETPTGAWVSPTGHTVTTVWNTYAAAYDGNLATGAVYPFYPGWWPGYWTTYLILTHAGVTASQVKFPNQQVIKDVHIGAQNGGLIQVEIYYGGAWHEIYYAESSADYITVSFPAQTVTSIRYRAYNTGIVSWYAAVNEIAFWDSTGFSDDTANWKQGLDERTIRCAIAHYDADAEYVVSYTHAAYLIALDDITSRAAGWRSGILSKAFGFDSSDVDTLQARGRTKLTDLKVPIISIDTGLIDLSAEEGREWEELSLGDTVTVIDEQLGIENSAYVVRVSKPDLNRPQSINIEIANKTKDIIDYLKE